MAQIRERVDPQLYETFRKIILKEEKEEVEKLRRDSSGCTQKCRVKNSYM